MAGHITVSEVALLSALLNAAASMQIGLPLHRHAYLVLQSGLPSRIGICLHQGALPMQAAEPNGCCLTMGLTGLSCTAGTEWQVSWYKLKANIAAYVLCACQQSLSHSAKRRQVGKSGPSHPSWHKLSCTLLQQQQAGPVHISVLAAMSLPLTASVCNRMRAPWPAQQVVLHWHSGAFSSDNDHVAGPVSDLT